MVRGEEKNPSIFINLRQEIEPAGIRHVSSPDGRRFTALNRVRERPCGWLRNNFGLEWQSAPNHGPQQREV